MAIGIVGSRGFIGSYLLRYLVAKKLGPLRILVRTPSSCDHVGGTEAVCGDLRSLADCERFAADLGLIYYLAHTSSPVNSDRDQANDTLLNLVPLLNLIQAVQHLGTKPHIVYFSSGGAVYAPKLDRIPYVETDNCAPLSSYGIQKLAAEQYLRLAGHRGYLTSTVLRVGNAYGTPLPQSRLQGLIGVAINSVLQKRPVRFFGELSNVRDYIHLEDICTIADRASAARQPFTVVNVGSGLGHSVLDVLHLIEECYGGSIEIQSESALGRGLPEWIVLDTTKALQEFAWSSTVCLRDGIELMLAEAHQESRLCKATAQGLC
jgi:UDP-glucose 4-epimerase